MNKPFEQPDPSKIPEVTRFIPELDLEQVRALSDSATANGMPMNFDTALHYASVLQAAEALPILPVNDGEKCLKDLEPTEIFDLAEALDVVMQFDPDEKRRYNGAALVVDLQSSLSHLPGADADARTRILAGILKVDPKSPAAEQLAERYFSAKTNDEREIVANVIISRSRIIGL